MLTFTTKRTIECFIVGVFVTHLLPQASADIDGVALFSAFLAVPAYKQTAPLTKLALPHRRNKAEFGFFKYGYSTEFGFNALISSSS
jgi:hypothetical protein